MKRLKKTFYLPYKHSTYSLHCCLTASQRAFVEAISNDFFHGNMSSAVRVLITEGAYALGMRTRRERDAERKRAGLRNIEVFEKNLKYKGYEGVKKE
jgi:hypothetical protein